MSVKIDFVVTWLDSSDPEWQAEFAKYRKVETGRMESARFRNLDIFNYWFRAVEQYAPWVNKVFLVTNGTFPKWINPNHPKLVLVKHSDFIPAKYLPTFNSRTIELHLHRIKNLSEHFVYHNDDTYINAPINPEYYFKNGLPCDCNQEQLFSSPLYSPQNKYHVLLVRYCDIAVLNYHFSRKEVVKQSKQNWYGMHLGLKGLIISAIQSGRTTFEGFKWHHNEQPFLKSVFEEAWEEEEEMLSRSCTRFRQDTNLNVYFMRYWQFATNRFYPKRLGACRFYPMLEEYHDEIITSLGSPGIKSICINDTPLCSDELCEKILQDLHQKLIMKFPVKSSFEI